MVTECIDTHKLPFDVYISEVKVTELHQPMGFRKYCSDLFPMGKGTFILEDNTRVHASKVKHAEQDANGDFHITLKD